MKKMSKIISVIAALAIAALCCGCGGKGGETTNDGNSSNKSMTVEAGKLIMATNAEFPPYEFYQGDTVVGIDAEIARAIAEDMGCELVIEDMAFDSIISAVDSGKADVGVAGMSVTKDRLQNVNFSDPYTSASQVIIFRK